MDCILYAVGGQTSVSPHKYFCKYIDLYLIKYIIQMIVLDKNCPQLLNLYKSSFKYNKPIKQFLSVLFSRNYFYFRLFVTFAGKNTLGLSNGRSFSESAETQVVLSLAYFQSTSSIETALGLTAESEV